jgi:uncharacterized protein
MEDRSRELTVTVLTTLHCNFACDYCYQGDHVDGDNFTAKMSLETAARVGMWIEQSLDTLKPERLRLRFAGGEPLLNVPAIHELSRRSWSSSQARDIRQLIEIVTNGLLLTPDFVDCIQPYGLNWIRIALEEVLDEHERLRSLRGRWSTLDRIAENVQRVSSRCKITIEGSLDETLLKRYPQLQDVLTQQRIAPNLAPANVHRGTEHTIQPDGSIRAVVV